MTKIRSTESSHVQDRRGQGGGGGLSIPGLGGGGGLGIPMKAGGGIIGLIILAAAILLPQLLGGNQQSLTTSGNSPTAQDTGVTQCETELEQILCGATDDVQEYWATAYPQAFTSGAYRPTDTVFFSGATNTGCGQASAQTGPFYCPADSYVYFDLDFLTQLQEQFGALGDLASQYIVAHEFGHHIQNLSGISAQVAQREQADPANANAWSVALELQADCLAGAWAHDAEGRGQLDDGEINEALNAAAAVGDDRIQQQTQGRVDPDTYTHGTSEQRVQWFRQGFETGDPRQCNTFNEL